MKKKIDFRQIEIPTDYDGKDKIIVDASKDVSAIIFSKATNYDDFELGRQMHQNGEIEIDKNQAETIKRYVTLGTLTYFAQSAINGTLDNLFNNN